MYSIYLVSRMLRLPKFLIFDISLILHDTEHNGAQAIPKNPCSEVDNSAHKIFQVAFYTACYNI
jgi:hypothetical protein